MTPLQSYLLLALCGIAAYLITVICDYINRCFYIHGLKKFYENDINRYKAKKIMQIAKNLFIENGYNEKEAERETIIYIDSVTRNGQLDEKYKLMKRS